MSWKRELDELAHRMNLARRMGGDDAVAKQHQLGKLTARERIDALADPDTFQEFAGLVGEATYEGDALVDFLPKPQVDGFCRIDGRKVVVSASDFSVRGGATVLPGALGSEPMAQQRALEARIPYVRLLDAVGGSVRSFEEIGRTYLPDANSWTHVDVKLLNTVPVASAVMGSVAGLPAVAACLAHWNVMVKGTSQLFPGGPPVVKAALGVEITKEELGGWEVHGRRSGVVDNVADSDEEALDQVKRFLSYLPSSVHELSPQVAPTDAPERRDDDLADLVPHDPRAPYDAHHLVEAVVDRGSFFEIAPLWGTGRVTGLARVDGYPVGVMANNPKRRGGVTDVAAGEKVIRLIQLCDAFHLPLVSFADEPGFMVGVESELQGIERAGARLVYAVCESRMPWVTVVVRRLYGVAGQCQHRPTGLFRRYAWPSARWGSMPIKGGAMAAYRREIESADDPQRRLEEIEARLEALTSPFRTAEATGQDIIDPRDTRPLVVEFVEDAQRVLQTQLGPPPVPYRP